MGGTSLETQSKGVAVLQGYEPHQCQFRIAMRSYHALPVGQGRATQP